MKIVVNTRLLRKDRMDGIGWFTFNTLRFIVRKNPHIEFHFLFDSAIDDSFIFASNVKAVQLFPPAKHALLNILWFEWSVARYLKKENPDLFLSPDGILSLRWGGAQFAVIHDINFVHNPKALKFSNRKYYTYFFPKFAKKAKRIATVSDYSKQDISQTYGIPESDIDVVYCGVNTFFHPNSGAENIAYRKKCSGGKPYFIFIGTLSPRKNILGLMQAFEKYKEETGFDTKLLIVGWNMYKGNELYKYQSTMHFGSDVIFAGHMSDTELNNALSAALALVFVPFFEGFGIPVIEAMQCDVPVIASNITSVPEVAGNAALLVDPSDIDQIKTAMVKIAADESLRNSLIVQGRLRKQYFSWERTADLLWDSVSKCLKSGPTN